jgi:hypothetical protein
MDRDIAVAKLKALAQGAEIARKKHAKRGQRPKTRNARRRTR